jgi:hypothetical protein
MPIYSHFKNMQALEDEVVKKAWGLVDEYQTRHYTGDVWIDQAIGYIRFAREEKHLFKCRIDCQNQALKYEMSRRQWDKLAKDLDNYGPFSALDEEKVIRTRYTRAMLSHGVATAARIGLNKIFMENDILLARFLTDASMALIQGYQKAPPLEGEEKALLEEKVRELIDNKR